MSAAGPAPRSPGGIVARNTLAQAAGKVVVLGAGAASIAVTTRYLGAAGYGRFALALALLQTLGVLADAGLVAAVVRESSRAPQRTAQLVGNALALRLALGVVVVALAAAASGLPAYGPDVRTAVLIASAPFALGIVSSSLAAVFQVRLQLGRAAVADAAGRVASLGALLAVVAADLGFAAVVASAAAGAAVTLAITAAFVRVRPAADRAVWRELAVTAVPLGLTLAVAEIYFRADTFILALSRPVAEVGHYSLAYRLYELLALFPGIVMASVFPLLSRQLAETRAAAERTLNATARAFWTLGAPLAAGGLVLAPELARLAGGDAFAVAADPLRLLLCAAALAYLSGLYGFALIAGRRERSALWLALTALAANLALNAALAPSYGATASAAIALASEALLLAGGWLLVRRWLGLAPTVSGLWRVLLAAAVMAAAVWPLRDRTPALTVPLGAAVYGAVLWAVGGVDRRTLEALRG
ncbi:MAG: oligosaccharide flippase family protein [Solirubrobacteraceae bacterium]